MAVIASGNSGKQPGEDNVPTKLLEEDGEDAMTFYTKFVQHCVGD